MDESLRNLMISTYQTHVRLSAIPEELKRALKTSERVPSFMANLEKEFSHLSQSKLKPTKEEIIMIVQNTTDMFLGAIQTMADEALMSEVEKNRIKYDEEKKAIFNQAADSGEVTEETIDVLTKET